MESERESLATFVFEQFLAVAHARSSTCLQFVNNRQPANERASELSSLGGKNGRLALSKRQTLVCVVVFYVFYVTRTKTRLHRVFTARPPLVVSRVVSK